MITCIGRDPAKQATPDLFSADAIRDEAKTLLDGLLLAKCDHALGDAHTHGRTRPT